MELMKGLANILYPVVALLGTYGVIRLFNSKKQKEAILSLLFVCFLAFMVYTPKSYYDIGKIFYDIFTSLGDSISGGFK
jgi:hypothetical protein